jgi:5-oxoprolinase (ATP-hydrolysing) subunit A
LPELLTIDLNCDLGELPDLELETALMRRISSANIACGEHAGNPFTMRRTVRLASEFGVSIGAHPGYPDRENFGRVATAAGPEEIEGFVFEQVAALAEIAEGLGASIRHVKPHGALYNLAAKDSEVAAAIGRGVARLNRAAVLFGLAGSLMLEVWAGLGFPVAAEAFADRAYEPDGSLRPRSLPGALITDPDAAADQALRLVRQGRARTLCVHGDTPGAPAILQAVRTRLEADGICIAPVTVL